MPRGLRRSKLFPVALSINALADAMMLRPDDIADVIERADVPVWKFSMRKRVLIQDFIDGLRRVGRRDKKRGPHHD
jgi:hypothetical protein